MSVTAKAVIDLMMEDGFLELEEIRNILKLEADEDHIEKVIERLLNHRHYKSFLNGEYKQCTSCKELFINKCFKKIKKDVYASVCNNCCSKMIKE